VLHQRDQRREHDLLRQWQHAVAVRVGQEVLRARAAADLVELQLRAGGEEHRLRRAGRPGQGGAGPRGLLQDGALVLDDERAQGHAAGVRRHHQRRTRVQREEHRRDGGPGAPVQNVLPAARRRPGGQPHLLEALARLEPVKRRINYSALLTRTGA
jgi:hypothetical protein